MKPFLLVDFYKTISFGALWHLVPQPLQAEIQKLVFADDLQSGLADRWMRGYVTSEEVNRYVATELNTDYQELWNLFVQSSETIGVNERALELINTLRTKYITVLFTDNMDSLDRFTAPAYSFDTVFDKIINSANSGFRKGDEGAKFFKLIASDFKGSILLDDRPSNCSLFNELGGTAYLVTPKNDVEHYLRTLL